MNRTRALLAGGVIVTVGVVTAGAWVALRGSGSGMPGASLPAPRFVEETASSGLQHTYDGGPTFATGGGVAVFDCDEDGRPDIYLAGGANPAALYRNESATGGALRFTAVHDPVTDLTGVTGAYPVDIDGDGHVDLAVLRVGGADLLRGLGGCRFDRGPERCSEFGLRPERTCSFACHGPGHRAAGISGSNAVQRKGH